jgi:hypothetical protein
MKGSQKGILDIDFADDSSGGFYDFLFPQEKMALKK